MTSKVMAACIVAALLSTSTQAFEVAKPFTVNDSKFLECSVVRTEPRDRDSDPVYKINVSIVFNNSGSFESINAVHTVRSGKTYDRTHQYVNGRAWAKPGYLDWFWEGWRGNNNQYHMVGHVYHNDRDGWMYTEELFINSQRDFSMVADCHEQEGD
jgi:hypothetical protein